MFSERLRAARQNKKLSQREIAKMLYISQQAYAKYETGAASPNPDMLSRISEILDVSVDELTGRQPQDTFHTFGVRNIFPIEKKKIPLLGKIACGKPIYADEDRESYVIAGTDINADFCLRAYGDSMVGARILDGDIVFIKQADMVNNGEIAAVVIGDETTLKRVYYYPEKGKLVLNPENPKYEPLVYIGEELNEIHILGKAIAFQSDVI